MALAPKSGTGRQPREVFLGLLYITLNPLLQVQLLLNTPDLLADVFTGRLLALADVFRELFTPAQGRAAA
jgi:hypothetical protein